MTYSDSDERHLCMGNDGVLPACLLVGAATGSLGDKPESEYATEYKSITVARTRHSDSSLSMAKCFLRHRYAKVGISFGDGHQPVKPSYCV